MLQKRPAMYFFVGQNGKKLAQCQTELIFCVDLFVFG